VRLRDVSEPEHDEKEPNRRQICRDLAPRGSAGENRDGSDARSNDIRTRMNANRLVEKSAT
jgi:hypothetical protein